jgi:hypothetical protein
MSDVGAGAQLGKAEGLSGPPRATGVSAVWMDELSLMGVGFGKTG